jgi:hypothetical protein
MKISAGYELYQRNPRTGPDEGPQKHGQLAAKREVGSSR